MMEVDLTDLWRGSFGNEYTRRNAEDTLRYRRACWHQMLPFDTQSVLEVGANVGLNLEAISLARNVELYATEPNDLARDRLLDLLPATHVTADAAHELRWHDGIADLVMTCGVLIHVPSDRLAESIRQIYRCARRYILVAEYFAPQEEMIEYRGNKDMLWRRDYGSIYLDTFPDLQCLSYVFLWKRATGLDNLTVWVLEKGRRIN